MLKVRVVRHSTCADQQLCSSFIANIRKQVSTPVNIMLQVVVALCSAGFPDGFQELHSRRAGCLLHIRVNNHSKLSCIKHKNVFGFLGNPHPAVSPHRLPPVRAWQLGRLMLGKVNRDRTRQCHSHLPWIPRSQSCWNAASSALGKILCQPCYCLLAIYTSDTQLPGERRTDGSVSHAAPSRLSLTSAIGKTVRGAVSSEVRRAIMNSA
jgi:hypothetical protein